MVALPEQERKTPWELVRGFVEKSGGIDKVELATAAIKRVHENRDYQGYIRRVAATEAGARQLCAGALAGFALSAMIYRATIGDVRYADRERRLAMAREQLASVGKWLQRFADHGDAGTCGEDGVGEALATLKAALKEV